MFNFNGRERLSILIIILLGASCNGIDPNVFSQVPNITRFDTADGPVVGEIVTTLDKRIPCANFLGIPYAQDPSGPRRFKPPEPVKKWKEAFVAIAKPPMCKQIDVITGVVIGEENCLYLNVFTPKINPLSKKSHPVIVWIHGGAFQNGDSSLIPIPTDLFVEEGLVVVTFNYRLGVFGFLNLHHQGALGNAGLKDQNLALKWVKRNIRSFGGNPNDITIVGDTAGAVSVDLHLVSEMSEGLFQKSISMSGSPFCLHWGFQKRLEAETNAKALGDSLELLYSSRGELIRELRNADANDLTRMAAMLRPQIPFRPTLESIEVAHNQKKFMTECTYRKLKQGNFIKGPHLTGYGSFDGRSFCESNAIDCRELVGTVLSGNEAYFRNVRLNEVESGSGVLENLATDILFAFGVDLKERLLNSLNGQHPVYYYHYSGAPLHTRNDPDYYYSLDSEHSISPSDEVVFAADTHEERHIPKKGSEAAKHEVSSTIRRFAHMWANFAIYGDPTPMNIKGELPDVKWPSDSRNNGTHLQIGVGLEVLPRRPIRPFVENLFKHNFPDVKSHDDCIHVDNITSSDKNFKWHSIKSERVQEPKPDVSDKLGKQINDFKEQFPSIVDEGIKRTGMALNGAKDYIIREGGEAGNYAGNKAKQALNSAKTYAIEKSNDFIENKRAGANEYVDTVGKNLRDKGKAAINNKIDLLANKAIHEKNEYFPPINSVQNFGGLIKGTIGDVLEGAVNDTDTAVKVTGEGLIDDSIDTGEGLVKGEINLSADTAKDLIDGTLSLDKNTFKTAGKDYVKGSLSVVGGSTKGVVNTAGNAAENGGVGFTNVAANAAKRLDDDLVNGTLKLVKPSIPEGLYNILEPGANFFEYLVDSGADDLKAVADAGLRAEVETAKNRAGMRVDKINNKVENAIFGGPQAQDGYETGQ